jgi:hypothetical protein
MRTRRSPRNLQRLWKALGSVPPPEPCTPSPILTDSEIDSMWWLPKTSRSLLRRDAAKKRNTHDQSC